MEEKLQLLIDEIRGLRDDMRGLRADISAHTDKLAVGLAGITSNLQIPADDGGSASVAEMLNEGNDILDENAQRLQYLCDSQASAMNALAEAQTTTPTTPVEGVSVEVH